MLAMRSTLRHVGRRLCSGVPRDGGKALAARFEELTDLADDRLGAKVLFATDEWFATADNMLKSTAPHFDPETFCTQGKVMDGCESRLHEPQLRLNRLEMLVQDSKFGVDS